MKMLNMVSPYYTTISGTSDVGGRESDRMSCIMLNDNNTVIPTPIRSPVSDGK